VSHLPKQQNIGIDVAKNAVLPLLLDEFLQIEYLVIGRHFDLKNYVIAFQKTDEHTNGGNLRILGRNDTCLGAASAMRFLTFVPLCKRVADGVKCTRKRPHEDVRGVRG